MDREQAYKDKIKASLDQRIASGLIPELGEHKKGKVRDIHMTGDRVIMVATDRVSAFDSILNQLIPFKGLCLNLYNAWAFQITEGIAPNALLPSPDPNVVIQRRLKNSGYECVVRGFVWGSLAGDYEKGNRVKCGIEIPEGMLRYQRLDQPIFTPTTKAEKGHDEDITFEDIVKELGPEKAKEIRDKSVAMYVRGQEVAQEKGMNLLDTKFEWGFDEEGNLYVIDESLTPDSSRYAEEKELAEKFPQIVEAMKSGNYKNVSKLIEVRPELKITEASKQYVRDILTEAGYRGEGPIPDLTEEQVIETTWRYIDAYEKLTGNMFEFHDTELPTLAKRIMNNLTKAGITYGGCVVPILASEKDKEHWEKERKALEEIGVPYTQPFFASAHKQTRKVLDFVEHMDRDSIEPLVYLTSAGRSNGLGPVVAGNSIYPVIACNPFTDISTYTIDIHSSLRMPSGLPLMTVVDPGNAAKAAKRIIDMIR